MKSKLIAVGALAAVLAGQSAFAKTLEDVLKEKGVITEEDYKEVAKSAPVKYKVGGGFTFQTPDDKFKLAIGGRLQARYTFTDKDNANGSVSDTSEWRVRRMKMWMKGHAYTKDLTYKLQANFVDGGSEKLLEDAFLNYRLMDEVQLLAGQDKVPFARQELTSSGAQQFVDRSNTTDTFKPGRDIGAMLHGQIEKGLVEYAFGWYGGAGQSKTRSTNDNAIAARIEFNPFGYLKKSEADLEMTKKPLLSFGADYYRNKFVKGESNNTSFYGKWLEKGAIFAANEKVEVNTASADIAFKWMGASAQAEYFWAQADGDAAAKTTQRAHGFYAQAGYFIIPKHLEAAVRYSYVDPNRDKTQDLRTETQGAVSYYFNKHNLKLQADVTNMHQQNVAKSNTDDMQYRLQAQIIF
ncbi:porin [Geobacter sp.]|uniref:porin n=1 Tax=Geobacter sp. TaxID=46610 RepID=UPI0026040E2F|nr:porin [Geobacter sp.]